MLSFCNEELRAIKAATTSEGVGIAEETAKRADICDAETRSHLRLHLLEDGGSRHPLTFLVAGGRSEKTRGRAVPRVTQGGTADSTSSPSASAPRRGSSTPLSE